ESATAESATAESATAESATAESTTAESATDKPARGLGLSLGAIMTAEHDAQADLALFKDQPETDEDAEEPDSESTSAVASKDSQAAPVRPFTDEPYQPVGMHPRSVAATSATTDSQDLASVSQASDVSSSSPADSSVVSAASSANSLNQPAASVTAAETQPQVSAAPNVSGVRSSAVPSETTSQATRATESVGGADNAEATAETDDANQPTSNTAAAVNAHQPVAPVSAPPAPATSATATMHNGQSAAPSLDARQLAAYKFPPLDLLTPPIVPNESEMDDWIEEKAETLEESLHDFGVDAHVSNWTVGPTVTQFQVKLERGVKVNKITNLNDDLKLALAARDIRIEAPIPGHNTVGIEIPNMKSRPVMLAEVLDSPVFKDSQSPLTVALGVDLFGKPQVTDLRKMPHGLIAGATGSGKSVFINSILVSILYKANPQQVKLLLIDPKAVELAPYNEIPHLLAPVVSEPKAASAALKWVVDEMDHRYSRLAAGGARNIEQFNKLADKHGEPGLKMPYIVIVIDELADLMMVASSEVQDYIARITAKARAAGIHLLVATQRPSVDVVTGVIKNNIPTRVAFMTSSQVDSRTILDTSGAERLLGKGDMLFLGNGKSTPIRLQGTFVDNEIDDIAQFVRDQAAPHYEFQPDRLLKHEEAAKNQDELLPEVLTYLTEEDTVSVSQLQRHYSIGYNRAANIIDDLESRGYVSGAKGSKPRDVYFTADDLTKLQANS
ncbi:DNA translocase FtsK, partial [Lactiplantibacillus modestisalitolerans]